MSHGEDDRVGQARESEATRHEEAHDMKKDELPGTIQRSPDKAQRTFQKTHDTAVDEYGDGERAHRTAYAALKHEFEKVGDHWEPKDEKGPSDERAARQGSQEGGGATAGGVDVRGHSKKELYERARDLDISGRSKMSKQELAEKIAQKQD